MKQPANTGLHVTIKVSTEMRKGCDFDVYALVTNQTSVLKKCRLVFASRGISYDGTIGEECGFKDLLNVELQPGGGVCLRAQRKGFLLVQLCMYLFVVWWWFVTVCN